MNLFHYHSIITFDGSISITDHPSFTSALDKARTELAVERLMDRGEPRARRRTYTRREYIPGVYAEWLGHSLSDKAQPDIRIEVSTCTPALHEQGYRRTVIDLDGSDHVS